MEHTTASPQAVTVTLVGVASTVHVRSTPSSPLPSPLPPPSSLLSRPNDDSVQELIDDVSLPSIWMMSINHGVRSFVCLFVRSFGCLFVRSGNVTLVRRDVVRLPNPFFPPYYAHGLTVEEHYGIRMNLGDMCHI